ncbi:MAG: glutamine-hydrolyzing carbamoyl-phosphate synthase small subunit [Clostridia bacterium]|nr:glutamine-hydrolyzing carbamoyl-phosphate synthase small subunit [Clostridia bacterium]
MKQTVYLTLQNGKVFQGTRFGADGDTVGELVFTTGMTGYIETLTDPSYYGQIVTQTFPLIGNYGMISKDFESKKSWVSAYVVREWCETPSNFRSEEDLDACLKRLGIIGVYGVDTRELTKIVRETGVMNAAITSQPLTDEQFSQLNRYAVTGAVKAVSCKETSVLGEENTDFTVVLYDFGAKYNIERELVKRGCKVIVVPGNTKAEEALSYHPDGIMLTNGPGDPSENTEIIAELKKLAGKLPIFGICLGHQLFALAMGGKTRKMKYGHRGANQPVKNVETGRVYISSQNHGYEVLSESLPKGAKVSYVNANDMTCEGVDYDSLGAFTVQFHPEACAGPLDCGFLFDRFIANMKKEKHNA